MIFTTGSESGRLNGKKPFTSDPTKKYATEHVIMYTMPMPAFAPYVARGKSFATVWGDIWPIISRKMEWPWNAKMKDENDPYASRNDTPGAGHRLVSLALIEELMLLKLPMAARERSV